MMHGDEKDEQKGGKANFAQRMLKYRKGTRGKKRGKARKSSR